MEENGSIDNHWMLEAIKEATQAGERGEVPVGAIIVYDNRCVGTGCNSPIQTSDPTAHAEIIALRRAAKAHGNYRLPGSTLYVTLEPCIMCMGAIILARIDRLVFGAEDPKSGAAVSKYSIGQDHLLNHKLEVTGGVLQKECGRLLTSFFSARRKKS